MELYGHYIAQVVVSELLEMWGDEGLKNHVREVRFFYRSQRDAMLLAAERHLSGKFLPLIHGIALDSHFYSVIQNLAGITLLFNCTSFFCACNTAL